MAKMAYKFGYWDDPKNCRIRSTQERPMVDYEQAIRNPAANFSPLYDPSINHESQVTEQQSLGWPASDDKNEATTKKVLQQQQQTATTTRNRPNQHKTTKTTGDFIPFFANFASSKIRFISSQFFLLRWKWPWPHLPNSSGRDTAASGSIASAQR